MSIFDEFGSFFKRMRVYLLGRGLLSTIVMATTFITGAIAGPGALLVPTLVVAVGGALFSAGMRIHEQKLYEEQMTDLYREDIAKHLGMNPKEVTREHLKIAARDNEVIEQALARQRRMNIVSFATSALAAVATFGLLYVGLASDVSNFFAAHFNPDMAKVLQIFSTGVVSGTTSLVLHNGLEEAIGHGSGLSKAVAHDLIVAMDRDVKRGRSIAPEQVYAVLVAENTELKHGIAERFGTRFDHMTPREQRATMNTLGVTQDMTEIAEIITKGEVPPGRLAYMIHYARPHKPREEKPQETGRAHASFVERLGAKPLVHEGHAAREEKRREATFDSPAMAH